MSYLLWVVSSCSKSCLLVRVLYIGTTHCWTAAGKKCLVRIACHASVCYGRCTDNYRYEVFRLCYNSNTQRGNLPKDVPYVPLFPDCITNSVVMHNFCINLINNLGVVYTTMSLL